MKDDITIVCVFYDIGRGNWSPDKGFPHYIQRTNETYLERFSYLAQLDNKMIIWTTENMISKVMEHRKGKENKTKILTFDYFNHFYDDRMAISEIQHSDSFQNKVKPHLKLNPEYWDPDYVLLMALKPWFVKHGIKIAEYKGFQVDETVAYIDFGYMRTPDKIPESKQWKYNFDPAKIHLFGYKDYEPERQIEDVIFDNDVYFLGAQVVAHKSTWQELNILILNNLQKLMKKNLVDDDQTLWLMTYLEAPDLFEVHRIPDHQLGHDPFVLFQKFNNTVN